MHEIADVFMQLMDVIDSDTIELDVDEAGALKSSLGCLLAELSRDHKDEGESRSLDHCYHLARGCFV